MAKKPPPRAIPAKQLQSRTGPPLGAFLRLLVDREQNAALKRLLAKYSDPTQQHQLLRILQGARFSHQLRTTLSTQVSRSRKWFMRRDRWRERVDAVEQQLDALLRDFQKTIYPLLRASNSLPSGYSREVGAVFFLIEQLKKSIKESSILSTTFTKRGHQPQPYLKDAVTVLRRLKITEADANEFLTLIGVKPDPFA